METALPQSPISETKTSLRRINLLLGIQSIVVILVSINRLSTLTLGFVASNQFLRWVDLNNMLILPLISVIAFYLLKKEIEGDMSSIGGWRSSALNLVFIIGIYLLGASYGTHEVTNYLHLRFCPDSDTSLLCQIIVFNDDAFSHWVFFTGFVLVNTSLLILQDVFPFQGYVSVVNKIALILNGLLIGAGIFANLAFEEIGLDLYIVALLAGISLVLLRRKGPQPLFIYYSCAYTIGLIATGLVKLLT